VDPANGPWAVKALPEQSRRFGREADTQFLQVLHVLPTAFQDLTTFQSPVQNEFKISVRFIPKFGALSIPIRQR
jgi:hypothetical protein